VGLLLLLTWLISQFTFISTMAFSLSPFSPHECVKVDLKRSFVERTCIGRAEHWILCTAERLTDFNVSLPVILIEDAPLGFNSHNKTNSLLRQNTTILYNYCGPGSSVGIATEYGLDGPGSNPGGDEIFRPSRRALGPAQPPVQWVPCLSRG